MDLLNKSSKEISDLCKSHAVQSLYAFGSIVRGEIKPSSDIDLVVSFKPFNLLEYADNYFDLKFKLQELLLHPIDLLEEQAIRNTLFKSSIEKEMKLVYGS